MRVSFSVVTTHLKFVVVEQTIQLQCVRQLFILSSLFAKYAPCPKCVINYYVTQVFGMMNSLFKLYFNSPLLLKTSHTAFDQNLTIA
jgi:hypothetical protein